MTRLRRMGPPPGRSSHLLALRAGARPRGSMAVTPRGPDRSTPGAAITEGSDGMRLHHRGAQLGAIDAADETYARVHALATELERDERATHVVPLLRRALAGSVERAPRLAADATRFGFAMGRQLALLHEQRLLLCRLDALRRWEWDYPELERENYYRAQSALRRWRADRALLSDLLAGDPRAVEHALHAVSFVSRWGLTSCFALAAATALLLFGRSGDPRLALLAAVAASLSALAARWCTADYVPSQTGADATWSAALDQAFLSGVQSRAGAGSGRGVDEWLAHVEAAFAEA